MTFVSLAVIRQSDDDLGHLMLLAQQKQGLDVFFRALPRQRFLGMRTEKQLVAERDSYRLTPHVQPEYPHRATMTRLFRHVKFPLPPDKRRQYKCRMSQNATALPVEPGARDLYVDAELYDHEYRRRKADVAWYRQLAKDVAAVQTKQRPILELGSGTGRLLVPLARDGHQVIGVDRSPQMVLRCQQRLSRQSQRVAQNVQLIEADFRALPLDCSPSERFRLIVCPFNGLLHLYERQDLERFLTEVRRLLHPDGLFAFDAANPDPQWLARDPNRRWSRTRFRHPRTGEPLVYSTNHDYDPASQVMTMRLFYEPDAKANWPTPSPPRTVILTQRMYFPAELAALLHYNGFSLWYRAGGFDGQPLSPVSAEQVICARVR